MCPDPREELADILNQATGYLAWMKDDGVGQIDVPIGGAKPLPETGLRPQGAASPLPAKAVPVPVAERRPPVSETRMPVEAPRPQGADVETELSKIAGEIALCRKCPLHAKRTKTVPGQGNPRPDIMFIGEAPGADEDEQGLAFVGRAGQLLTKMIEAMGYKRDEVFIANICKCRPPDNRKPEPGEMATCIPYLKRQIAAIQPRVIVALGATAVEGLLNLTGISRLRGNWQSLDGIDVMPTFHPSYLLRNPAVKKEAWADLQAVLKRLGRTPPPVKKS